MAKIAKIIGFSVLGVGVAMAAAVAGVFVYVQNANLAELTTRIVKSQTGLELKADALQVDLWPVLHVQTKGLVVPAFSGSQPLLTLDEGDVQIAWGSLPFFYNNVQLKALTLKNPTVHLVQPKQGLANWQNPATAEDDAGSAAPSASGPMPARLPLATLGVLDVSNLNVTYLNEQNGQRVEARNVNLGLDGTSLNSTKLTLDGRVNGQPVNGNLTANLEDLRTVPLDGNLTAAGLSASLKGATSLEKNTFNGMVKAETPNLKATLATLLGKAPAGLAAAPFKVQSDLLVGAEDVDVRSFNLAYSSLLTANGTAKIKLGSKPSANGSVQASGDNLAAVLGALTGSVPDGVPATPFVFSTKLAGQDEIRLDNLTFNLPQVLALTGNLSVVPAKNASDVARVGGSVTIQGTSVARAAQAFGVTQKLPTQPFNIALGVKTDVKDKQARYALSDINARLGTLAALTGDAVIQPAPTFSATGNIQLRGDDLAAMAKAFDVKAAGLPATPFRAEVGLSGSPNMVLNPLNISLPGLVEAGGQMTYSPAAKGKVADVSGNLNIATLNLTALGYCTPTNNKAPASIEAAEAKPVADTPWTDAPIDLSALRSLTANVTLTAKGIACAGMPLNRADAKIINTPSALTVDNATLGLGSGQMVVNATLNHAATPRLSLGLSGSNIAAEEFVATLKDKGVRLPMNLDAKLDAAGASSRALVSNLNGAVKLNATDGQLPFTNLLGNVVAIERLLQSNPSSATGVAGNGSGQVDNMDARLVFTNGVGTFETLTVATGRGAMTVNGTGTVDLPRWLIDMTLTPTVNTSNGLAVPVDIKGPLSAPAIAASPAFVKKLSGRLAGEALKLLGVDKGDAKGIGGALGGVLSGEQGAAGNLLNQFVKPKNAPSPTTEGSGTGQQPAAQEPDPAQLIRGLLGR